MAGRKRASGVRKSNNNKNVNPSWQTRRLSAFPPTMVSTAFTQIDNIENRCEFREGQARKCSQSALFFNFIGFRNGAASALYHKFRSFFWQFVISMCTLGLAGLTH